MRKPNQKAVDRGTCFNCGSEIELWQRLGYVDTLGEMYCVKCVQGSPELYPDAEPEGEKQEGGCVKPKRTPGPWKRGRGCVTSESNDGLTISGAYEEKAKEHYGGYLIGESVSDANVDFIVKACNNHDALMIALNIAKKIVSKAAMSINDVAYVNAILNKAILDVEKGE